jgi:hypothetical protein
MLMRRLAIRAHSCALVRSTAIRSILRRRGANDLAVWPVIDAAAIWMLVVLISPGSRSSMLEPTVLKLLIRLRASFTR